MNNYHTHTYRCKHATGDVADYVEAARAAGLGRLGFSDHVPLPDGRWPANRMGMEELSGYLAAVREAGRKEESRSDRPIDIILGLECEWAPAYDGYLGNELLAERGIQYLVSGTHFFLKDGAWEDAAAIDSAQGLVAYARHLERSLASGLFAFVAHPDLFCMGYLAWDKNARACAKDVLAAAASRGIPLEINGYGMRKPRVAGPGGTRWPYPHEAFWDLARDYDIRVILSSDAHRPVDVATGLDLGRAMAEIRALRIVDTLELGSIRP